jgi:hypothetical protein
MTTLAGHSQAIASLRCRFLEANIGNGVEHFGRTSDYTTDKPAMLTLPPSVCFVLNAVQGVVYWMPNSVCTAVSFG